MKKKKKRQFGYKIKNARRNVLLDKYQVVYFGWSDFCHHIGLSFNLLWGFTLLQYEVAQKQHEVETNSM